MTKLIMALAAAALLAAPAYARGPRPPTTKHYAAVPCPDNSGRWCADRRSNTTALSSKRHPPRARVPSADPRPARWCAYWLRRHLGIPRSAFRPYEWNLARAFRYIGTRAARPAAGVIVVWRHHVGIITGRRGGRWVVKSGNDGHRVRERPRSLRGRIALRWPPGSRWAGL